MNDIFVGSLTETEVSYKNFKIEVTGFLGTRPDLRHILQFDTNWSVVKNRKLFDHNPMVSVLLKVEYPFNSALLFANNDPSHMMLVSVRDTLMASPADVRWYNTCEMNESK